MPLLGISRGSQVGDLPGTVGKCRGCHYSSDVAVNGICKCGVRMREPASGPSNPRLATVVTLL